MKEQDKWRDQHGKPVTDITPEESIDLRVQEVYTKTKQTPISYQQARVITVCRNELAPLLDKIVDNDGKIPSGKQVSDIQEELRVAYFNFLTSDNPPEPVSSEDEATKAGRLDMLANDRTNSTQHTFTKSSTSDMSLTSIGSLKMRKRFLIIPKTLSIILRTDSHLPPDAQQ